jgi:enoyl-CoA hydratase/3-hydroxyacyl-CoA dehydrogenase
MGAGIVVVFLLKGYQVILKEINEQALLAGVERILDIATRFVKKQKLPMNAVEQLLRTLKPQITYDGFESVDLVIEAAVENIALKQNIFAELEKLTNKNTILATNTSTIDIEVVGAKTKALDRIIGLHYFSPAHVMPLLEIVRTKHTSPDTIAVSVDLAKVTGKTPVVVGNCVGFTANRIFFPYGQAASFLADAGVDPYRIDKALESWGMPMGVYKMSDLSGIDIFVHVSGTINAAYGERCYNSTLGHKLAAAKRLGQKTGAGYYTYKGTKAIPDPKAVTPFLQASRADAKGLPKLDTLTDEQILEVILYPVVNESLRVLKEGHVIRESDIDVISVLGYGFPAYRGGILHWAQEKNGKGAGGGYKHIRDRLQYFSNTWGANNPSVKAFFAPSDYLQQLANKH